MNPNTAVTPMYFLNKHIKHKYCILIISAVHTMRKMLTQLVNMTLVSVIL